MAAPTVESVTNSSPTGTTHAVAMPATVNAGDLLLMVMALASSALQTASTPSGWTLLGSSDAGASWCRLYWFHKVAVGNEGGTNVNVTISANTGSAVAVYRLTGLKNGTLADFELGSANNTQTTTPDPPLVAPSWGDADESLFIAAISMRFQSSSGVSAYPTNMPDNRQNVEYGGSSGNDNGLGIAMASGPTSSFDPDAFGQNLNDQTCRTCAIRGTASLVTPVVTDVQPRQFANGDLVEITGTGFKANQGNGKVELGDNHQHNLANKVQQNIDHWEDLAIRFIANKGSLPNGQVFVFVTNDDGETNNPPPPDDPGDLDTEIIGTEVPGSGRSLGSTEKRLEIIYAAVAGHTAPDGAGRSAEFLMHRIGRSLGINITSGTRSFETNLILLYNNLTGETYSGNRSVNSILSAIESHL